MTFNRLDSYLLSIAAASLGAIVLAQETSRGCPQGEGAGVSLMLPVEHRWEIADTHCHHTAKHVQEIPPERSECLSDTMAPVEELGSVLGCILPWTVRAFTRRGLERKMRRWERRQGFAAERVKATPIAGVRNRNKGIR